jgi:hypothetical protein
MGHPHLANVTSQIRDMGHPVLWRDRRSARVEKVVRAFARMPTHAMKPHEWGTRILQMLTFQNRDMGHPVCGAIALSAG